MFTAAKMTKLLILTTCGLLLTFACKPALAHPAFAEYGPWPGELKVAVRTSPSAKLLYRRPASPQPAKIRPIPRLVSFTQAPGGIYFCSGLDNMIYVLRDNTEKLALHIPASRQGVIRRVRYSPDRNRILFSLFKTPVDNEGLSDGAIYSFNMQTGGMSLVSRVSQSQVNNDWWGQFVVSRHGIFVSSNDTIYGLNERTSQTTPAYRTQFNIKVLAKAFDNGTLAYVTPDGEVRLVNLKTRTEQRLLQLPSRDVSDFQPIKLDHSADRPARQLGPQAIALSVKVVYTNRGRTFPLGTGQVTLLKSGRQVGVYALNHGIAHISLKPGQYVVRAQGPGVAAKEMSVNVQQSRKIVMTLKTTLF